MKTEIKNSLALMAVFVDFLNQMDEEQLAGLLAGRLSLQLRTSDDERMEALVEKKLNERDKQWEARIAEIIGAQAAPTTATPPPLSHPKMSAKSLLPKPRVSQKQHRSSQLRRRAISNTPTRIRHLWLTPITRYMTLSPGLALRVSKRHIVQGLMYASR